MTPDMNKRVVLRFVDEAISRQNLDVLDELVAADFLEHVPFPGQGPGREGLRQTLALFHRAFPDIRWEVREQIAEGDKVVSRFNWTGTHRGVFLGVKPTGNRVEVWGIVIDVLRDGKMTESRIIMDIPTMMEQLG